MSREMNLVVKRGTTLKSGKIFSLNESIPADITYADLMAGIADGTYTKKSLTGKTYKGQVRDRAGATMRGELSFDTAGDVLTFSLPAATTLAWPTNIDTLFYDVLETTTATGVVLTKVYGKIKVEPTITIGA